MKKFKLLWPENSRKFFVSSTKLNYERGRSYERLLWLRNSQKNLFSSFTKNLFEFCENVFDAIADVAIQLRLHAGFVVLLGIIATNCYKQKYENISRKMTANKQLQPEMRIQQQFV